MTEQFAPTPTEGNGQPATDATPFSDKGTVEATGGNVDTKSVEHQMTVMQQRLQDKDDFIKQLQGETKELRDTIDTFETRMSNMETISQVLKDKSQGVDSQNTIIDEDALAGKVIKTIQQKESKKIQDANYDQVMGTLTEQFGSNNVQGKVKEVAAAEGLTLDYMAEIARQSPNAFYKLMGLNGQQQHNFAKPTHSTVSTPINTNQEKNVDYYTKMRRENPAEFSRPEIQREYRLAILNNIEK